MKSSTKSFITFSETGINQSFRIGVPFTVMTCMIRTGFKKSDDVLISAGFNDANG